MWCHVEHVVVAEVLYETWKFGRVTVTTREEKLGNFALYPEEEKIS